MVPNLLTYLYPGKLKDFAFSGIETGLGRGIKFEQVCPLVTLRDDIISGGEDPRLYKECRKRRLSPRQYAIRKIIIRLHSHRTLSTAVRNLPGT